MKRLILVMAILLFWACKEEPNSDKNSVSEETYKEIQVEYAKGFSLKDYGSYKILEVRNPFPDSDKTYTYLLTKKGETAPENLKVDAKISIPVEKMVVTSTTHIPALESLHQENTLIGFPHLDFISSEKTRNLIAQKKIAELGENENLNMEILISLQPEVVVGFAMKENDKTYSNISRSGISVIYNGDWNEQNPMGKAEWIKFFGALYDQDEKAAEIFEQIKTDYAAAKDLAKNVKQKPRVLSGALYKDIWHLAGGKSWMAEFIADAGGDYVYKDNADTGSLSLSFESVFDKAQNAEIWVAPGGFTAYEQMNSNSAHYKKFKAFQDREIYGYAHVTGETGGVLYFELAPNRPDLVLKDLIHIFHPDLLPDYENIFFKELK